MNKLERVQAVKDSIGLSKFEADSVMNLFFSEIATALAKRE